MTTPTGHPPRHQPNPRHTLEEVLKTLQDLIRNDLPGQVAGGGSAEVTAPVIDADTAPGCADGPAQTGDPVTQGLVTQGLVTEPLVTQDPDTLAPDLDDLDQQLHAVLTPDVPEGDGLFDAADALLDEMGRGLPPQDDIPVLTRAVLPDGVIATLTSPEPHTDAPALGMALTAAHAIALTAVARLNQEMIETGEPEMTGAAALRLAEIIETSLAEITAAGEDTDTP